MTSKIEVPDETGQAAALAQSPFSLHGKTVLVTGASSGIGKATAQLCAELGAAVIVCGRDIARLETVLNELPGADHRLLAGDLTNPVDRQTLLESAPPLDGCVFSAGVAALVPIRMVTQAHIDAMFSINYNAPVLLTQGLLAKKKIKPGASLVYVTAIAEHTAPNATAVYSGAKAALTATVRAIAVEQAKNGVRANCVSPGYVSTPMLDRLLQVSSMDQVAYTPLGTILAEDIAAGIVFMLAPATRRISRTSLTIDGGISLHIR